MSKVLLLGGTGAIGVYLSEILAADGKDVVVTSRSEHAPCCSIEFIRGDARNADFLSFTLDRVRPDAVVDFMSYGTDEFKMRRDLLLGKTRHYLFLSSYRVFNDAEVITEKSPRLLDSSTDSDYLKTDEYALCKARSENLLRESSMANWTIIRPGITYSKRRFQLGCLEANTLCYRSFQGLPVAMPQEMRTINVPTFRNESDVQELGRSRRGSCCAKSSARARSRFVDPARRPLKFKVSSSRRVRYRLRKIGVPGCRSTPMDLRLWPKFPSSTSVRIRC